MPTLKKINRNDCPKAISTGLSTIEGKLTSEEYLEPWQYVEDVWLMFESARSSLSNTSQAYEFTTEASRKLSVVNVDVRIESLIIFFPSYPKNLIKQSIRSCAP